MFQTLIVFYQFYFIVGFTVTVLKYKAVTLKTYPTKETQLLMHIQNTFLKNAQRQLTEFYLIILQRQSIKILWEITCIQAIMLAVSKYLLNKLWYDTLCLLLLKTRIILKSQEALSSMHDYAVSKLQSDSPALFERPLFWKRGRYLASVTLVLSSSLLL